MHFVFGGRHMGMQDFARGLRPDAAVRDLAEDPSGIFDAGIVNNIHLLVRSILETGGNPVAFFRECLPGLRDSILIGDEVGCGVVPVEPFERLWRDEVGRVYQLLAENAAEVTRLWAGIPQTLKRTEDRP